uniref:Endoglucanase n=1 Tax=Timema cristinae TaxID=61476 RepID=A0A7R9CKH0_TIMCR|nr:unnamed protein product [Timema cristinae]
MDVDSTEEELPSPHNYKQMLLAQLTLQPEYMEAVQNFCDFTVNYQKKTPKGLVYIDKFGTLGHAANVAFICLQISLQFEDNLCGIVVRGSSYGPRGPGFDSRHVQIIWETVGLEWVADIGISSEKYRDFVKSQIHYMLGESGRSYVVGFGLNYPTQPYHAASSCPDLPEPCGWKDFHRRGPNSQILYGALVSGPDENDNYKDDREEYVYNEVTLDYNAGFQSAVAGLQYLRLLGQKKNDTHH